MCCSDSLSSFECSAPMLGRTLKKYIAILSARIDLKQTKEALYSLSELETNWYFWRSGRFWHPFQIQCLFHHKKKNNNNCHMDFCGTDFTSSVCRWLREPPKWGYWVTKEWELLLIPIPPHCIRKAFAAFRPQHLCAVAGSKWEVWLFISGNWSPAVGNTNNCDKLCSVSIVNTAGGWSWLLLALTSFCSFPQIHTEG